MVHWVAKKLHSHHLEGVCNDQQSQERVGGQLVAPVDAANPDRQLVDVVSFADAHDFGNGLFRLPPASVRGGALSFLRTSVVKYPDTSTTVYM